MNGLKRFLHASFQPIYSDGVTVIPDAPMSEGFTSSSLTDANLTFAWSRFKDPSIESPTAATQVVNRHEWTLLVKHTGTHSPEHLYPWKLLSEAELQCVDTVSKARNNNDVLRNQVFNTNMPITNTDYIICTRRPHTNALKHARNRACAHYTSASPEKNNNDDDTNQ